MASCFYCGSYVSRFESRLPPHFEESGKKLADGSGPSRVLVVSGCKEPAPGMTRIGAQSGDRYMLQFDIPKSQASIREGATDAPPLLHAFGIRPNDSESRLGSRTVLRGMILFLIDCGNLLLAP